MNGAAALATEIYIAPSSVDSVAPRDAASGQATGKRQYEPITINGVGEQSIVDGVKSAIGDLDRDGLNDAEVYKKVESGEINVQVSSEAKRAAEKADVGTVRAGVIVRGWDSREKVDMPGRGPVMAAQVLEEKGREIAKRDENIRRVLATKESVEIDYSHPGRLFGFFDITYRVRYSMDKEGRVKVRFPWYRFMLRDASGDLAKSVEYVFQNNETNLDFLKLQDDVLRQTQALQTLSSVLKTKHDTVKNSIGNIR